MIIIIIFKIPQKHNSQVSGQNLQACAQLKLLWSGMAGMDNCFVLVRTHQHIIASGILSCPRQ